METLRDDKRSPMKRVILESPYAGDVKRNLEYARAAMADCLHRGEAPFASHLLYTQPGVLDDSKQWERDYGIKAGFAWRDDACKTVFYVDQGFSTSRRAAASSRSGRYRTGTLRNRRTGLTTSLRF